MQFLIYLDKWCLVKREIADHGQKLTQPICALKGCGFHDADGLCFAEIASYMLGNERARQLSNLSNLISNGMHAS